MELNDKVIYVDGKKIEDIPYEENPTHTIEKRRLIKTAREQILGPSSSEYVIETYKHWGGKLYMVPSNPSDPEDEAPMWMGCVSTASREEVISTENGPESTDEHILRCRKYLVVRQWYFLCVRMRQFRNTIVNKYQRVKRAIKTDDEFLTKEELDNWRDY